LKKRVPEPAMESGRGSLSQRDRGSLLEILVGTWVETVNGEKVKVQNPGACRSLPKRGGDIGNFKGVKYERLRREYYDRSL